MNLNRLNKKFALFITEKVGTMWCAYAFTALALISLPEVIASEDPRKLVSWIAQTFLQLVLLPIIIVGQNIQSETNTKQSQADSNTLVEIKQMLESIREKS